MTPPLGPRALPDPSLIAPLVVACDAPGMGKREKLAKWVEAAGGCGVVGERAGVTRRTVERWREGTLRPSPEQLVALAAALGKQPIEVSRETHPEHFGRV